MDHSAGACRSAWDQFEKASTAVIAMIVIGQSLTPVIEPARVYVLFLAEGSPAKTTAPVLVNDTLPVGNSFLSPHERCSFIFY